MHPPFTHPLFKKGREFPAFPNHDNEQPVPMADLFLLFPSLLRVTSSLIPLSGTESHFIKGPVAPRQRVRKGSCVTLDRTPGLSVSSGSDCNAVGLKPSITTTIAEGATAVKEWRSDTARVVFDTGFESCLHS